MMDDGESRGINFKRTIIILTSNACTYLQMKLTADPETTPKAEGLANALMPKLNENLQASVHGGLATVRYFSLRYEWLKKIVTLMLGKIQRRIHEAHKIELRHDLALVDEVVHRGTEVESGAHHGQHFDEYHPTG